LGAAAENVLTRLCDPRSVQWKVRHNHLPLPDMSGFDVLLQLVPKPRHPEIALIFLTRLILAPMKDLALNNGAQAYLVKSHSSGDELDTTIHKALASVAPTRKESR